MTRFFDILFSMFAIAFFSPVLLIVMFVLKLTGEHEIFYLQERVGKGEKLFNVFKFATMLKNSPSMSGGVITRENDPRVLPVGKFLRKTKLNELPQLFNIILGQMSIIGPRPLTKSQFENYSDKQRKLISELTPGLSGLGSLIFRDEESIMARSGLDYEHMHDVIIANYKGDLESWYYNNKSLFLYFKIIVLTVISILFPKTNVREMFNGLPTPPPELLDLI